MPVALALWRYQKREAVLVESWYMTDKLYSSLDEATNDLKIVAGGPIDVIWPAVSVNGFYKVP